MGQVARHYSSWSVREREGRGWYGRLSYKDGAGKWQKTERKLSATAKRAAEAECRALFARLNDEAQAAPRADGRTVLEHMEAYVAGLSVSVEPSTVTGYRTIVNRQVGKFGIASVPLSQLSPDDVRSWLAELGERYSPTTALKAFVLLKAALKQAAGDGVIAKSPAANIKGPKKRGPKPNALDERQRKQLAALLAQAEKTRAVVGETLALYTGMREGEICAVRWRCVDLQAGTLEVSEALGKTGRGYYVKEPKNRGSKRVVYLPEPAVAALRARRASMMEDCMAAGVALSPHMFVLGYADRDEATGDYRFYSPHVLWQQWSSTAALLGLVGTQDRNVTFHDLRHTYATAAIAAGVDVKTVSSSLGHSNASMTLDIYADADPDAKRRSAQAVTTALSGGQARADILPLSLTGTDGC